MAKSDSVSREYTYHVSGRLASASTSDEATAFSYDAAGDLIRTGKPEAVASAATPTPEPNIKAPPPPQPVEPAVRFCTKCGAPRTGDARFCAKCGTAFGA